MQYFKQLNKWKLLRQLKIAKLIWKIQNKPKIKNTKIQKKIQTLGIENKKNKSFDVDLKLVFFLQCALLKKKVFFGHFVNLPINGPTTKMYGKNGQEKKPILIPYFQI